MTKRYCTCKRAICICVGLIAGLGAYQEYAIEDYRGRPMIEAEAAPGTYSVTGSMAGSRIPTMTGDMVTDGEARAVRFAFANAAVTISPATTHPDDDDYWGLRPKV